MNLCAGRYLEFDPPHGGEVVSEVSKINLTLHSWRVSVDPRPDTHPDYGVLSLTKKFDAWACSLLAFGAVMIADWRWGRGARGGVIILHELCSCMYAGTCGY